MPLRVRINNQNRSKRIKTALLKKCAISILKHFKKRKVLLDITYITDKNIRALNRRYMGKDMTTDVLSFSLCGKASNKKHGLIGDIYVSSDMAFRNAKRFGAAFEDEIFLYTIHGVLHVLGFGDKTEAEKRKIRRLETIFLKAGC